MQYFFGPPIHPPAAFPSPFPQMGGMPPYLGAPPPQALKGGAGLLSRLFGGGASGAAPAGMNMGSVLTNAQRILGLTQQAVPMVQQYGPLVRNLPAIWRILREPAEEQSSAQESLSPAIENKQMEFVEQESPTSINGLPLPKLYI